jgi:hypothetical protein
MDYKILNEKPQIILKKSFLNESEISRILENNRFSKSTIVKDGVVSISERRTSETYEDKKGELKFLAKKIFKFLISIGFDYSPNNYENIQLIKYEAGREFKTHHDFLSVQNDRVGTVIIYLKKPIEGGKTIFDELDIQVEGDPGDLLFFRYDNDLKEKTLHSGEKVLEGTKIIATMFIRGSKF